MKKFDGKVQMLDAGMVLFETKSDFGDTLGQVKAEMEVYGKVLKPADLSEAELPESTGECDLFLDWSTIWRVRYISCHLESADGGESDPHRYAATFKEGNRSTKLRGAVMAVLLAGFVLDIVFLHGVLNTICAVLLAALTTAYVWILPSRKAQKVVKALMKALKR